ncbi:MAG: sodium-dependent bicarbonate transport family permease [Flammeovirgaceae bacterium]
MLASLLSPMVLAFLLGIAAARLKSDLKFPEGLYTSLTIYLLVAIGMKGGYKLSLATFNEVIYPAIVAVSLCCLIPLWTYGLMRKVGKFSVANAAALAAHYGSVSAVTFSAALAYHENLKIEVEGFMPSMLAMMEIPAILIGITLARINSDSTAEQTPVNEVARELLAGKSSLLLMGFLLIGFLAGKGGWEQVSPLFDVPFKGILTLFLLEAGLVAGRKLSDLKKGGAFLLAFGIMFPILHATIGIYLGQLAGLSMGGATVLGILAASASYIAAPAACRVALPEANPSYYLTSALAITFPFNIIVGIPIYHQIASMLYQ